MCYGYFRSRNRFSDEGICDNCNQFQKITKKYWLENKIIKRILIKSSVELNQKKANMIVYSG